MVYVSTNNGEDVGRMYFGKKASISYGKTEYYPI